MISLGARWDSAILQNERFEKAKKKGFLDYVEVNYPIGMDENPSELKLPILAHTSNNPLCSAHGIDYQVASKVKEGVLVSDYPWVGEHLAWLNAYPTGTLGYVISPLFLKDFKDVAVSNITELRTYYGKQIALELGPVYGTYGDYESEMHFLGEVAQAADALIILDVTHWLISNKNLKRPMNYGLDALELDRVVELHVAGMRSSVDGRFWYDAHQCLPSDETYDMVTYLLKTLPNLQVVTFEHDMLAPEDDFYKALDALRVMVDQRNAEHEKTIRRAS